MTDPKTDPSKIHSLSKRTFRKLVEFKGIKRLSVSQYREKIRAHYDGPAGAVLSLASLVSLHEPLIGRLLRKKKYDVTQAKKVLDIGSGAGQIMKHVLKQTGSDTQVIGFDLSQQMLVRARNRINNDRADYIAGDLRHLPFADNTFDSVTCGWVIEYFQDPHPALAEINRVLTPNGSALILATEDNYTGAMNSRTWKCRTYNRQEFEESCEAAGLSWKEQLWFTRVHRFFKIGGILIEATKKDPSENSLVSQESTEPVSV
jgi:ubiquinone/menaquinone biosynthesis C-methylase UbiE